MSYSTLENCPYLNHKNFDYPSVIRFHKEFISIKYNFAPFSNFCRQFCVCHNFVQIKIDFQHENVAEVRKTLSQNLPLQQPTSVLPLPAAAAIAHIFMHAKLTEHKSKMKKKIKEGERERERGNCLRKRRKCKS